MKGDLKVVFTAMSKKLFYFREHISVFAFAQGVIPINPFMQFSYFLLDRVDRNEIRDANNRLIERVDELWVFGDISDGMIPEIILADRISKPIRYFSVVDSLDIIEISPRDIILEPEAKSLLEDTRMRELFQQAISYRTNPQIEGSDQ
ncbi:MAG: hypothetical protein JW854_04140 [Actinobacteria bacterium]|nr:hypothetical protein [Actinomycetota bacterium]